MDLDKRSFLMRFGDESYILPSKLFQYLMHILVRQIHVDTNWHCVLSSLLLPLGDCFWTQENPAVKSEYSKPSGSRKGI